MRLTACLLVVGLLAGSASVVSAEPPAPMADRVTILTVEMNRGPAEQLAPFLTPQANPLSRTYALRALGRIGDRGKAPEMLAAALDTLEDEGDLRTALWAAGIAKTDKLFEAIETHLTHEQPGIVAEAAEALGWTGKDGAAETISPLLTSSDPQIKTGALMGLARCRNEGHLERVVPFVHHADARVRRAADFCCWYLAGARKRGAREGWDGEPTLLAPFRQELGEDDPERRLAGVRSISYLLPTSLPADDLWRRLMDDPDARVSQEAISRIFSKREGAAESVLIRALDHRDPKVRAAAAEALAEREDEASRTALEARAKTEKDTRVEADLLIALAKRGTEPSEDEWHTGIEFKPLGQTARAAWLLAMDHADARKALIEEVTPKAVEDGSVHAVVAITAIDGLKESDDERVTPWLRSFVGGAGPFDFDDPYVAATAIGALGERGDFALAEAWCQGGGKRALAHVEVRAAMQGALGALAKREDVQSGLKLRIVAALRDAMGRDPSAWVQKAAHKALEELGEDVPAANTLKANDWRGLPRPSGPVLGVDLSKGEGEWLSEGEILQLADAIVGADPKVVFETTQGPLTVSLDPDAAPVHCVALVLAVTRGDYADTRWHRVVPSFVIQGGDPHGHGGGNCGYFIPDEITRMSYVRGVLGMPKSQDDDGGCQLFFMHSPYIPLDGRYSAYGTITDGWDALDAIRVGDRITAASTAK